MKKEGRERRVGFSRAPSDSFLFIIFKFIKYTFGFFYYFFIF